jgi:hypothetical protein
LLRWFFMSAAMSHFDAPAPLLKVTPARAGPDAAGTKITAAAAAIKRG